MLKSNNIINPLFAILFVLFGVSACSLQKNILSNDCNCGERSGELYTLTHNDSIVNFVQARFPGGNDELISFIKKYISSNYDIKGLPYNGTLFIRITISEKGEIEEYTILKHVHDCTICDSIAVNMIKSMPSWIPAYGIYKNGEKRYEKDQAILPVRFLMNKD